MVSVKEFLLKLAPGRGLIKLWQSFEKKTIIDRRSMLSFVGFSFYNYGLPIIYLVGNPPSGATF